MLQNTKTKSNTFDLYAKRWAKLYMHVHAETGEAGRKLSMTLEGIDREKREI